MICLIHFILFDFEWQVLATFSGGAIKEDIGETNSVESVGFSPR